MLVVALLIFGVASGFSIGAPFILLGLTLICVAPLRGRPTRFWPPIAGVVGLVAGYVLTAPYSCSSTGTAIPGGPVTSTPTTCRNVLGLVQTLPDGEYGPTFLPALAIGLVAGVGAALLTWWALSRRRPAGR